MIPEALKNKPELIWARRFVWLYFWLILFEGVLRKWIFPDLANPLLIIRDPVVIIIYLLMAARNRFPINGFIIFSAVMAFLLGIGAMFWGHGNFLVMLYGLRTNFLHLPLIFVIAELFSLNDVRAFGKAVLWASLPMSVLIVLQFIASPHNILNASVGGTTEQIMGALGHVRPSGTFSFVTGTINFLALQAAFIADSFLSKRDRILRTLSLIALIFALVCSISRSAVVICGIVFAAAIWALLIMPTQIKRGLLFLSVFALAVAAASLTPLFKDGSHVMNTRFVDATEGGKETVSNSILQRIRNDLWNPVETIKTVSMGGAGTGAGTNVGAGLLVGKRSFLLAELEWSRLLLESGLILGLGLIGMRIALAGYLIWWAWRVLKKSSNYLPWILCSAVFIWVFNGGWGQPTMLGFACFGAGLILAATRPSYEDHPLFKYAAGSIKR